MDLCSTVGHPVSVSPPAKTAGPGGAHGSPTELGIDHPLRERGQLGEGGRGQVDGSGGVHLTVVDHAGHRRAVGRVGDPHHGPEGQPRAGAGARGMVVIGDLTLHRRAGVRRQPAAASMWWWVAPTPGRWGSAPLDGRPGRSGRWSRPVPPRWGRAGAVVVGGDGGWTADATADRLRGRWRPVCPDGRGESQPPGPDPGRSSRMVGGTRCGSGGSSGIGPVLGQQERHDEHGPTQEQRGAGPAPPSDSRPQDSTLLVRRTGLSPRGLTPG